MTIVPSTRFHGKGIVQQLEMGHEDSATSKGRVSCTRSDVPCFPISSGVAGNIGYSTFPISTTGMRKASMLLDEVTPSRCGLSLSFSMPGGYLNSYPIALPASINCCFSTNSLVGLLETVIAFIFSGILLFSVSVNCNFFLYANLTATLEVIVTVGIVFSRTESPRCNCSPKP